VIEGDLVVGIDLGTTNSEVAAFLGGRVRVLGPPESKMLPSCVGLSPGGELLVGEAARNQQLIHPQRTVRSIKRKMGSDEKVSLGEQTFSPQEISALILKTLVEWAERELERPVRKAVITVPAYFSDAQRQATREAGELAGLEVVRILNEPTAAGLAYGYGDSQGRTVLVYDLGGGTFDVSIVNVEADVTEVLASHGNNHLGGDDFDELLLNRLVDEFKDQHGIDLREGQPVARSRLWRAVEEAKKRLSFEPYVTVREENLVTVAGRPRHLEREISRAEYEEMIQPLVESTLESVSKAMSDARKSPSDLDTILLVGGATRTPRIARILAERTGLAPRQEVHPELCVALGAGVLASRLAGHEVERVLVDVSPYSFGPSYLGTRGGAPYPHCYHPIIERNTPLPVTRTDTYCTSHPYQRQVEIQIYQGDDPDALKNILVGEFMIDGLTPMVEPNEVLCRMSLDLDGILRVSAIEKRTGKSKHIAIAQALKPKTEAETAAARKRLERLYGSRAGDLDEIFGPTEDYETEAELLPQGPADNEEARREVLDARPALGFDAETIERSRRLVERSRGLLGRMHDEDKEEAVDLIEAIERAISAADGEALAKATERLKELLFFVEGK
jgi:molecular chaperone DnaK (HSP70)